MIKNMPFIFVFGGSLLDAFIKISLILILLNKPKQYRSLRFWVATLFLGIYVTCSYLITDNVIRLILLFAITGLSVFYIVKFELKELINIIIITFIIWILLVLCDVCCGITLRVLFNIDMVAFRENNYLVLVGNAMILFVLCLIILSKKVRSFVQKISSTRIVEHKKYIIFIIIVSVTIFSIIFYICQFNYSVTAILITSFIMVLIYTIVVLITIHEFNQKNKIKSEYEVLLTSLSEYENLLDRQRILNHENKNQLLVIKGMLENEESAKKYIDTLIDNHYSDNDALIIKTNKIPSGGLKGLIYYKMLVMRDKKINVNLEVNSGISKIDFSKMIFDENQNICKIVGVFLDNAIQEVENLNEKYINIIFDKEDDYLIIKISNNYGTSDMNRIGEKGYTTKGKGHGYGLKLVNDIVNSNKRFKHMTQLTGKVFSQIIKLKIKD